MELDVGVDLQLQIFILAGVFGFIFIIIIFVLAAICGQISKIKRQQRKLESTGPITGYDNYAYNSRNIQPDEELSRRGFTMYDPFRNTNNNNNQTPNVHQNTNNNRFSKAQHRILQSNLAEVAGSGEESRDAASEYSIANTETIVMTGNDMEMKITSSYPPEFHGIPPPPAFVNRTDIASEPNTFIEKSTEEQK